MSNHDFAIMAEFLTDGWRADCSCGYRGPQRQTVGEAGRDADEHRTEVQAGGADPGGQKRAES